MFLKKIFLYNTRKQTQNLYGIVLPKILKQKVSERCNI